MLAGTGQLLEYSFVPCIVGITMAIRDVPIHWGMAMATLVHFVSTGAHFTAPRGAHRAQENKISQVVTLLSSLVSLCAMFLFGGKRLGFLCCANAACLHIYYGSPLMTTEFPILRYSAAGDMLLLLTAGIIPMYGSYYAQELTFAVNPLLSLSFSLGLLAMASNHALNVSNISKDKDRGYMTLASRLTPTQAILLYKFLIFSSAVGAASVCMQWFSSIIGLLPMVAWIFLWRLVLKFEVAVSRNYGKARKPNPEVGKSSTDPISTAMAVGTKTRHYYTLLGFFLALALGLA